MKYFDTSIEDQETTISVLYEEQIIRIYSSNPKTIQKLTQTLGKPTTKYKKSKTYWSGASWNINFFENDILNKIIQKDIFIDKKTKTTAIKSKTKLKDKVQKENLKSSKEKVVSKDNKNLKKKKTDVNF